MVNGWGGFMGASRFKIQLGQKEKRKKKKEKKLPIQKKKKRVFRVWSLGPSSCGEKKGGDGTD